MASARPQDPVCAEPPPPVRELARAYRRLQHHEDEQTPFDDVQYVQFNDADYRLVGLFSKDDPANPGEGG
ncbi:uncharacterized protein HRG_01953 [Hirsutella rhossiliensis]|uniref:Uncharacterized protein n=1 Tax=Hirsutella rhossiliensis TaxID=111463 RepID=A0A9P8SLR4_9HYPO|nr:uncharacterized protein HRG_01953 [Hirsutella rhossiliensis]KAH0966544.1 hypothetical protein HRG_01953 [Hirsutella rhossiliensis]